MACKQLCHSCQSPSEVVLKPFACVRASLPILSAMAGPMPPTADVRSCGGRQGRKNCSNGSRQVQSRDPCGAQTHRETFSCKHYEGPRLYMARAQGSQRVMPYTQSAIKTEPLHASGWQLQAAPRQRRVPS